MEQKEKVYIEFPIEKWECKHCGWIGYIDDGYTPTTDVNFCPICGES